MARTRWLAHCKLRSMSSFEAMKVYVETLVSLSRAHCDQSEVVLKFIQEVNFGSSASTPNDMQHSTPVSPTDALSNDRLTSLEAQLLNLMVNIDNKSIPSGKSMEKVAIFGANGETEIQTNDLEQTDDIAAGLVCTCDDCDENDYDRQHRSNLKTSMISSRDELAEVKADSQKCSVTLSQPKLSLSEIELAEAANIIPCTEVKHGSRADNKQNARSMLPPSDATDVADVLSRLSDTIENSRILEDMKTNDHQNGASTSWLSKVDWNIPVGICLGLSMAWSFRRFIKN